MYNVFKTELDNYLNTNWTSTPIYDFANKPGKPPKYDPWIGAFKPLVIDDSVSSMSEGVHCIISNYVIEIPVFVGSAEGVDNAIALTEELKLLFLGKGLPGNITFYDVNTEYGMVNQGESSGSWYQSRVVITAEHKWFTT